MFTWRVPVDDTVLNLAGYILNKVCKHEEVNSGQSIERFRCEAACAGNGNGDDV